VFAWTEAYRVFWDTKFARLETYVQQLQEGSDVRRNKR
jgi:hypothetical protein